MNAIEVLALLFDLNNRLQNVVSLDFVIDVGALEAKDWPKFLHLYSETVILDKALSSVTM